MSDADVVVYIYTISYSPVGTLLSTTSIYAVVIIISVAGVLNVFTGVILCGELVNLHVVSKWVYLLYS